MLASMITVAQQVSNPGDAEMPIGVVIFFIAFLALMVVSGWKVFEKANQPGWAIIVPIYNMIVMLKIANKPLWWIVLFFLPIVSIVPSILVPIGMAKNFQKGTGFGIGMIFLPFIFYPILAFSDAEYSPAEAQFA